jgi:hypothetical protein
MVVARDRVIGILLGNVVSYFVTTQIWPVGVGPRIDDALHRATHNLENIVDAIDRWPRRRMAAETYAILDEIQSDIRLAAYEPASILPGSTWLNAQKHAVDAVRRLEPALFGFAELSPEQGRGHLRGLLDWRTVSEPANSNNHTENKSLSRSGNGYSLRFWRTTTSATEVMFQLYQHINGVGSPIDSNQELTGVFKPNTYITLSIIGNTFTATGYNTTDATTLFLQGAIAPNSYGGAGTRWSGTVPSGNSNAYSYFNISYPGTIQLVTTAQLTKVTDGYQAVVTVTNPGTGTAANVQLNTVSLGSTPGTVPAILLGNLLPGASNSVTVTFPASAGSPGAPTAEKFAGTYTGGRFGGSFRGTLP